MATVTTDRTRSGAVAKYQEKGVFQDTATYEASALPIADIIDALPVADGVTVLDVFVVCDALGASTTLSVGDGDSATYYKAATSTAAATKLTTTSFPKLYASGGTIKLTVGGAAVTGTITVVALMTAEATDLT